MPPITRKAWLKVRNWSFVEISELVSKDNQAEEESQLLQHCDGKLVLVHSLDQLKKKSKEGLDLMSWLEGFAVLVAIAGQVDTSSIPHLMAYQVRVIRAAKVKGSNWREFDRQYRRKAAAKGLRDWSMHDPDLWDRFVLTAAAAAAHASPNEKDQGYASSMQRGVKRSRDISTVGKSRSTACYPYNFDGQCSRTAAGQSCPDDHVCYNCGSKSHTHPDCPQPKDRKTKKKAN